jgi:hypothetical protein
MQQTQYFAPIHHKAVSRMRAKLHAAACHMPPCDITPFPDFSNSCESKCVCRSISKCVCQSIRHPSDTSNSIRLLATQNSSKHVRPPPCLQAGGSMRNRRKQPSASSPAMQCPKGVCVVAGQRQPVTTHHDCGLTPGVDPVSCLLTKVTPSTTCMRHIIFPSPAVHSIELPRSMETAINGNDNFFESTRSTVFCSPRNSNVSVHLHVDALAALEQLAHRTPTAVHMTGGWVHIHTQL